MSDEYVPTVRIRRPARVSSDGGRNVWTETIETAELELVSTTQLQALLQSGDEESRGAIREVLAGKQEGVLARDTATGLYEIVSEEDLKAFMEDSGTPPIRRRPAATATGASGKGEAAQGEPAQEFSLVSTQMLRRLVPPEEKPAKPVAGKPKEVKDRSGGFDPYNSG